ncbi:MAG: DUF2812 domain-containing protein [Anaerofustis stercorihominis]|nr:DUF2812 domain-containing protein [Anaerofustis stercorihominis]
MKKKKIYLPVDIYDASSLKLYFEESSREGLHFQELNTKGYGIFSVGEPQDYGYMLIPPDKDSMWPDKNTVEKYATYGWEPLTLIRGYYEVYRTSDKSAPLLNETADAKEKAYRNIMRAKKRTLYLEAGVTLIAALIVYMVVSPSFGSVISAIETPLYIIPTLILLTLFSVFSVIKDYIRLRQWEKLHSESYPVNNDGKIRYIPKWKLMAKRYAGIVLAVFMIVAPFSDLFIKKSGSPEDFPGGYPYIHTDVLAGTVDDVSDGDGYCYIRKNSSVFAKEYYEVSYGIGSGTENAISANIYCCNLNFAFLAEPLAEELMERYSVYEYSEIQYEGFDRLYAGSFEGSVHVLVCMKDMRVMSVRLVGAPVSESCFDEVLDVMSGIY